MSDGNSHFLMAIGRHDDGYVIEQLDETLRQVISAVRRTGKVGKLKLEMTVAPNGNGLKVGFKHGSTIPTLNSGDAFYFVDGQNDLARNPPRDEMPALFEGRALAPVGR